MTEPSGVTAARKGVRHRRARQRDESGASAVELVLYMPLLMIVILFAVQFSLIYLGAQVASGAAREGARSARVTTNEGTARGVAQRIVDQIGAGVLDDAVITVNIGPEEAQVTVAGNASYILPFLPVPRVSETVSGPVERYVQDNG